MNKTRAGSLLLFGAGAYGILLSLQLPLGQWNEPGAGAFPLIVSTLLTVSGIGIFLSNRTRAPIDWRELIKAQSTPVQIVALTLGFILIMEPLGFLLASVLYVFALLWWVSRYSFWVALALAIAIGAGSWYVFGKLFATPLPEGILGF